MTNDERNTIRRVEAARLDAVVRVLRKAQARLKKLGVDSIVYRDDAVTDLAKFQAYTTK